MKILVDTNIWSETTKPKPHPKATAFLAAIPSRDQFLSVLTVGEIRFGIERLPPGQRRARLEDWLTNQLIVGAGPRLLPLTEPVLQRWGHLRAGAQRTMPVIDSLIAATALAHGMAIATRNVNDFRGLGIPIINPFTDWEQAASGKPRSQH